MTRTAEAALLVAATLLAGLGVTLVNLAGTGGIDARVGLTLVSFGVSFGGMHLAQRRWAPNSSPYFLPIAAILTAVGYSLVYRIDPRLGSDQRWWLLVAGGAGVAVLFVLRSGGVAVLRRFRYLFLTAAVGLLLMPLLPASLPLHGASVGGSRLWVRLDVPFTGRDLGFQPGEVAKVLLVVFLASYLAERHAALREMRRHLGPIALPEPRQWVPIVAAFVASFAVLIYQRDLGASLLIFSLFVAMLYVATGRPTYPLAGGVMVLTGGFFAYGAFSHVQRRVSAWLDPWSDFFGSGFQVAQGLFAMGSGGLTGSGLGVGRPDLIPAAATDYVFAAVAEETGLAGAMAVLAGFALLIAAGFGVALRAQDLFRKLLAAGLALALGIQTVLILGGVLRLLPVTGITLPFMSYGGSSLVANMIILALFARISHEERA